MLLLAIANAGLVRLAANESGWRADLLYSDNSMRCLAVDPRAPSTIYTGSRGSGLRKSSDGGVSWHDLEFPQKDVFSLAVSAADGSIFAGTEPSMLFKSSDGSRSWRELKSLRELPSAPTWSFPPRPWTSHVRSIAPHPRDPAVLLAGIELGGLMRSEDGGESWADHAPGAQRDVHALAWHSRFPQYAYEAGGAGAAWSRDGGRTWTPADEGRDRDYTWGLAVDMEDPELWYVSASPSARNAHSGDMAEAHIYRWSDVGPWKQLSGGLPQPFDSMPYALLDSGEWLLAGLANGQIFASKDKGESWTLLQVSGAPLQGLKALAVWDAH